MSSSSASPSLTGSAIMIVILFSAAIMGYYQVVYIPSNASPPLPDKYLNPPEKVMISIVLDSYLADNAEFYVPIDVSVILGINNTVTWVNNDTVAHTATSDSSQPNSWDSNFILSDESWSYTFTRAGINNYHCTPHPWMKAAITVIQPEDVATVSH